MSLSDKATILPIEVDLLDHYWPIVVSFLQSAMEHTDNEIPLSEIRSNIVTQKRQLWVIKHHDSYIAAIVTQIYDFNNGLRIGEITIAGGSNHKVWDHFTDVVGNWFKDEGCKFVDIIGRPGWQRLYKDRGFRTAYVQLRKEL